MMEDWPVAEVEERKRRFAILRHLADTPSAMPVGHLLSMEACIAQGVPTHEDQALASIKWLEEMKALRTETRAPVVLLRITRLGRDVAQGRRNLPGVEPASGED